MAVKVIANYSKRLGLPVYSSHQFRVSVETELSSTDNVSTEASRLYKTLQNADVLKLTKAANPALHVGKTVHTMLQEWSKRK